jgi:hypothetical protein
VTQLSIIERKRPINKHYQKYGNNIEWKIKAGLQHSAACKTKGTQVKNFISSISLIVAMRT